MTWLDAAQGLVAGGTPCVLVTVTRIIGSAPREPGARSLVTVDGIVGSIGGGNLEYLAMQQARALIQDHAGEGPPLIELPLGPDLNQCCGGGVSLMMEPLGQRDLAWIERWQAMAGEPPGAVATPVDGARHDKLLFGAADEAPADLAAAVAAVLAGPETTAFVELDDGPRWLVERCVPAAHAVWLFGAGHVGRALAGALSPLPFRVQWVDSRSDAFPAELPGNVRIHRHDDPVSLVPGIEAGASVLIMTHSHDIDFDLCAAMLGRDGEGFIGLIGSATKWARFAKRLREAGFDAATVGRITCPIGLPGIAGKEPAVIAAATAAQLLALARVQGSRAEPSQRAARPVNAVAAKDSR